MKLHSKIFIASVIFAGITLCSCKDKIETPTADTPPQVDVPPTIEAPVIEGSPVDSRWELSSNLTTNPLFPWTTTGKCHATFGEGRGKSYFTAVSADGSDLEFVTAKNGPGVKGLKKDDYILFCVPMEDLPAGTDVDFMATLNAGEYNAPKDWIFEYLDNEEWKPAGEEFKITYKSNENHTSILRSFTTSEDIQQDTLKMRCRVTTNLNGKGVKLPAEGSTASIYFVPVDFQSCWILTYPADRFPAAKDSYNILALGNSFSFYKAPVWMLKEIARSQGHQMDLRMNVKGGQTFAQHMNLEFSRTAVEKGGYDYAILQDQSQQHSKYYQSQSASILAGTKDLMKYITENSPGCKVILENTWSYSTSDYSGFGSFEAFDNALSEGGKMLAEATGAILSPIWAGFAKGREAGYDMYHTDLKHQGEYGAYVKACINYLVLYGTPFDANVSDCNLPPKVAANLRKFAEEIVLKK